MLKTATVIKIALALLVIWLFVGGASNRSEGFGGTGPATYIQLASSSGYYPYWRYGYGYMWPYWRYVYPYPEYGQHYNYPKPYGFYNFYGGNYGL